VNKKQIFEKVKVITHKVIEVPLKDIGRESRFIDLGADEDDMRELMFALEEEFNGRIPNKDEKTIITVGDAVDYIYQRLTAPEFKIMSRGSNAIFPSRTGLGTAH